MKVKIPQYTTEEDDKSQQRTYDDLSQQRISFDEWQIVV